MADTTTQPNNKAVAFKGKPHREYVRKGEMSTKRAARRALKRGLISEKAAKKHLGDASR